MSRRVRWVLLGLLMSAPAMAAAPKTDLGALIKDLMLIHQDGQRVTMTIWFPPEALRTMIQAQGQLSPRGVDEIMKTLSGYHMVAVAVRNQADGGDDSPVPPNALRKAVTIEDQRGRRIHPEPEDSLPTDVQGFVSAARPAFEKASHIPGVAVFVFPGRGADGQHVADATRKGALVVHVGAIVMRYHTPLPALLPPAVDPKTHATFPGDYKFNPYTGKPLEHQPR